MTLHFFDNRTNKLEIFENIIEVEASDIDDRFDDYIGQVEAYGGWWELYKLASGEVVTYFVTDDEVEG